MEIEEAFTAYLLAYPGLAALISSRLYPDRRPQTSALPSVTYIDVSDVKLHTLAGQSKQESPMKQFTVYAATKPSARAVANQIKLALVDYSGTMGGLVIQKIELQNELSSTEQNTDGTGYENIIDLEFEIVYEKE